MAELQNPKEETNPAPEPHNSNQIAGSKLTGISDSRQGGKIEQPTNQYLSQLMPHGTSSYLQLAQSHVSSGIDHLVTAIDQGRLQVQEPQPQQLPVSPSPSPKREQLEQELAMLEAMVRAERLNQLKNKTEKARQEKNSKLEQERRIKADIEKKIQKWKEDRKIIELRRSLQHKKELQKIEDQNKRQEAEREKAIFQVTQTKKKQYLEFMRTMEERRQQRARQASQVPRRVVSETKIPPIKIQIKPQPKQQKVDFEQIKEHQKKFMEKIQDRSPKSISQLAAKHDEEFSLIQSRPKKLIEEEKERVKRRILFDQKVKEMPIETNPKKQIERLIFEDKQKYPVKYLVLGRKGLTDEDILKSTRDPIPSQQQAKQFGNAYLQQLRNKTVAHKSQSQRSHSLRSENVTVQVSKPPARYINYLSTSSGRRLTQQEKLALEAKRRPDTLLHESQQYQKEALQHIKVFSKVQIDKNYKECIQVESKIDDLFLKALKARVACMSVVK